MHLQVEVQVYTWLSERKINILFFNYLVSQMLVSEMEEMEQRKKEKEAAAAAGTNPTTASYTPDYAAGLVSPAPSVSIQVL